MIRFRCIALIMLFAAPVLGQTAGSRVEHAYYRFDFGSSTSAVAEGTVLLTPADRYDAARGYGWTDPPADSFVRPALDRSRGALTLDGVSGMRFGFRGDVTPGTWWVTVWIEAGLEDSTTLTVALNGNTFTPNWQAFLPSAEGRTELQKIYRVLHRPAVVEDGGIRLAMEGGADSVRVLALSLYPDPQPSSEEDRALIRRFEEAGRYGSEQELARLAEDLRRLVASNSSDAFAAYWLEQVELLEQAEHYRELMGWEWATDQQGMGLFDRYHGAVMLLDGLLDRSKVEDWPFYDRALFERGRLLYWLGLERGGPNEIAGGERDLATLHRRHPDDDRAAMYVGKRIDLPDACDHLQPAHVAPKWSALQLEALCRMRAETHWWVRERQIANGELGGKLGDDVEIFREWYPVILSGDTTTLRGYRRLADGVWNSDKIEDGYAKKVSDVEHASEFISDTAPAMVLFTDDPVYVDRLRPSARHFENLWTGVTPNGHRFFRSAWFSASEIETDPPKNRDVNYTTRAAKALRFLAHATGDEHVTKLLHEWSRSWADAARRTDKGKPFGIPPASIRYPDEAINGDEPTWYEPNMYWNYFRWAHDAGSQILDQLLHAYVLTGDEALLQPLFAALDLVENHDGQSATAADLEAGSPAWTAAHLRSSPGFWSVVEAWRLHTGDDQYDNLILRFGTPYARYRLTGNEVHLEEGLQKLLETVRYNTPLRTSEVLHTDRVYLPGSDHLQAIIAGGSIENSPYIAVAWSDTDTLFTALVTETGSDRLSVDLYSHGGVPSTIGMHVHGLAPGTYRMTRGQDDGTRDASELTVRNRGERIEVTLPPKQIVTLTLDGSPTEADPRELAQRVADRLVQETILRLEPVLDDAEQDGSYAVDFFDSLGRARGGVYYARAVVRVDSAGSGRLALGLSQSPGNLSVEIDGKIIYEGSDQNAAAYNHLDYGLIRYERTLPLALPPGDHELRLKMAPSADTARVILGFVDTATGIALPGVTIHAPHFEENDHFAFLIIGPFEREDAPGAVHPPDTAGIAIGTDYAGLDGRRVRWDKPRVHLVSALPERLDYSDWRYFTGTFLDALRDVSHTFDGLDYTDYIERHLDFFLAHREAIDRERYAYGLRESAFGHYFRFSLLDDMGMQAVPFAERIRRGAGTQTDSVLVERVVRHIMNGSRRLDDGTFARLNPDSLTVWADDLFMGAVILIRAADVLHRPELLDEAAEQAVKIHARLNDPETGLYWHGWFDREKAHSSSKWGRANGWAMMAKTELLQVLPKDHPRYAAVLAAFQTHAAALAQVQTQDGRWHQVLDNPETYLETSATAMFVRVFAEGVRQRWLPETPYREAAEKGWAALARQVRENGLVEGIVRGTPIFYSDQENDEHPRRLNDPRGLGAVLYAATAMERLRRATED